LSSDRPTILLCAVFCPPCFRFFRLRHEFFRQAPVGTIDAQGSRRPPDLRASVQIPSRLHGMRSQFPVLSISLPGRVGHASRQLGRGPNVVEDAQVGRASQRGQGAQVRLANSRLDHGGLLRAKHLQRRDRNRPHLTSIQGPSGVRRDCWSPVRGPPVAAIRGGGGVEASQRTADGLGRGKPARRAASPLSKARVARTRRLCHASHYKDAEPSVSALSPLRQVHSLVEAFLPPSPEPPLLQRTKDRLQCAIPARGKELTRKRQLLAR
jgi:hypothetical protein